LLVAIGVALGVAGVARAATVSVSGSTLVYQAEPGEQNLVHVIQQGAEVDIQDLGASLTAGSGCFDTGGFGGHHKLGCFGATSLDIQTGDQVDGVDLGRGRGANDPGTSIPAVVDLGPGDDQFDANSDAGVTAPVTVHGGDGNDTIFGGFGATTSTAAPVTIS
jgi:hypothetical protein